MKSLAGKRVAVLTTGHLTTSPRMTKAADAFAEAGAIVQIVSTRNTEWAVDGDRDIIRRRPGSWQWHVVDYRRESRAIYLRSGSRQRLALAIALRMNPEKLPLRVAAAARERVFPEIVAAARKLDVDFIYGGGAGLGAAYFAARATNKPFAVDLEDFHTGDQVDTPAGRLVHALSGRIEREVLPAAVLRTCGSGPINEAYTRKYGLEFIPVYNTFDVHGGIRSQSNVSGPLRLYWFSQTIGPDRGLEDALEALRIADVDAELHLQGSPVPRYLEHLRSIARAGNPAVRLIHHPPCAPDEILSECAKYDVGLSLETKKVENRDLCVTNKALAYVAAGMALVMTDTRGQSALAEDLGNGALVYREGDVSAFARQLITWARDRKALQSAKNVIYAGAVRRWNWDYEKTALIDSVARALRVS